MLKTGYFCAYAIRTETLLPWQTIKKREKIIILLVSSQWNIHSPHDPRFIKQVISDCSWSITVGRPAGTSTAHPTHTRLLNPSLSRDYRHHILFSVDVLPRPRLLTAAQQKPYRVLQIHGWKDAVRRLPNLIDSLKSIISWELCWAFVKWFENQMQLARGRPHGAFKEANTADIRWHWRTTPTPQACMVRFKSYTSVFVLAGLYVIVDACWLWVSKSGSLGLLFQPKRLTIAYLIPP